MRSPDSATKKNIAYQPQKETTEDIHNYLQFILNDLMKGKAANPLLPEVITTCDWTDATR